MANFKIVVSDPKSKKAFQKEIEQKASGFMGKRIGDKVKGDPIGLGGYEFQVTGGSDSQGFPMRRDVDGIGRKRVLLSRGTGFRTKIRGKRKRKSIRGNTISAAVSQINVKILTYGSKPLEELIGKTEKKEKLSEEEKKKKLHEELSGRVEEKAPEKSRSDQILEEQAAKEKGKAPKEEPKKEDEKEGKPAESKEEKEEPKTEAPKEEDGKEEPAKEGKPKESSKEKKLKES
jgi:small subunit ribosomal protein S6e